MYEDALARPTLAEQLARRLIVLIKAEGYQRGDRLPSTRDLAARFEVGYPTLREALTTLQTMGVVRMRHGLGIMVEKPEAPLVMTNPLSQALTANTLRDLIEVRLHVEPQVAALTAQHIGVEGLEELEGYMKTARENLTDGDLLSRTNMRFHQRIAELSRNVVYAQVMSSLIELFHREQRLLMDLYNAREADHEQHMMILAALRSGDPSAAEAAMKAHLEDVARVVRHWKP